MAKKMKAPRARRAHKQVTASARAQQMLRSTVDALSAAEQEVEKQVKGLLKRNRINMDEAADMLKQFQTRVDKERRKGAKELERRLRTLQTRVKKERHHVAKLAAEGVQSALAALNIPSRKEVSELTRKVDELSKKIDRLRRK